MTRINTNVSSLVAQNTLGRSNASLNQALTRLSTGLRINTGKDDPAGLIASENLRSDITSIKRAITNTDRANQVIATADSALGQVSSLLNDIRGLVTESANNGALSDEQLSANQLQVDSSLEALNRIAQTTTFQGRRLLDGSLDFLTTAGSGFSTVSNLKIDQANLGATGSVSVSVNISAAATKAQITNSTITPSVAGANGTATLSFADTAAASAGDIEIDLAAVQSTGTLAINHAQSTSAGTVDIDLVARQSTGTYTGGSATLTVTAVSTGVAGGAAGSVNSGVDILFVDDNTNANAVTSASYNAGSNVITVNADFTGGVAASAVATAIQAINGASSTFTASSTGTNLVAGDIGNQANVATGGRDASTESIALTGIAGAGGNATFNIVEANLSGGGVNGVGTVNNGGGSYTLQIDTSLTSVNISAIAAAIQATGEIATATYGGSAAYFDAEDTAPSGSFAAAGGSDAFTDNLVVTAKAGGNAAGAAGATFGGIDVVFVQNSSTAGGIHAAASSYSAASNTITLAGDFASGNLTTAEIRAGIAAIGSGNDFTVTGGGVNVVSSADIATHANVATGGSDASTETIAVVGELGAISNFSLNFQTVSGPGTGTGVAVVDNGGGSYTLNLDTNKSAGGGVLVSDIAAAILGLNSGNTVASATYSGSGVFRATDIAPVGVQQITGGRDAGNDVITVTTANETASLNGKTISIIQAASHGAATAVASNGNITVTVDSAATTSIASIAAAINNLDDYNASVTTTAGNSNFNIGVDNSVTGTIGSGVNNSGGLAAATVFKLAGSTGAEVLSFGAFTSLDDIVAGVNAVSDATGVAALNNGGVLEFNSTGYGSNAFVSLEIIDDGGSSTFTAGLSSLRDNGTDIQATVNGITASGDGNSLSVNTATLDLSLTVDEGSQTDVNFTITGGGALFQLGPDVVSNQQARLGITSVNTSSLGGVNGKLYQLGTGGSASLSSSSLDTAAAIVEDAINQVTSLRGRLGAFQRTTLETNKQALNDTLVNLTDAESSIRDADFASETAALTRAQILVQSGTTVLQIANSNPQNVLALLRG